MWARGDAEQWDAAAHRRQRSGRSLGKRGWIATRTPLTAVLVALLWPASYPPARFMGVRIGLAFVDLAGPYLPVSAGTGK